MFALNCFDERGDRLVIRRTHGCDHARPNHGGHLDDQASRAAGGCVHQRSLTFLQLEGRVRQIVRRATLEHTGGGRRKAG